MSLKLQVLEELIFDRVRTRLAIRELRAVDADLRQTIKETLSGLAESEEERNALALELLERAWSRLGAGEASRPEALSAAVVAA